nr:MAG TPA: hypothetical protein [Caudoviricetes sp.]
MCLSPHELTSAKIVRFFGISAILKVKKSIRYKPVNNCSTTVLCIISKITFIYRYFTSFNSFKNSYFSRMVLGGWIDLLA